MSIQYPDTFGEAFWEPEIRASKQLDDDAEKVLDPFVKSMLGLIAGLDGVPQFVTDLFSAFGTPGHFGLKDVGGATIGNAGGSVISEGLSPYLRRLSYAVNESSPNKIIELDNAATLLFRGIIPLPIFNDISLKYGYDEVVGQTIYRSLQPYPDVTDLFSYMRWNEPHGDVFQRVREFADVDGREIGIWNYMSQIRPTLQDVQRMFVWGRLEEQEARLLIEKLGYDPAYTDWQMNLGFTYPNPTTMLQSGVLRGMSYEQLKYQCQIGGIHPDYTQQFIDGMLQKPDPTTLIAYLLRVDPSLNTLDRELSRIGVHEEYFNVFRTLAYPVPPVADLITMAVREAFSPQIASRFGQYEDFPDAMVEHAAAHGISREWCERYWAAHWSLPSPQQGFEMLHRGVIDNNDLNLLLRALDIMPFWRDKLMQISYNPLTRVDVRRMYGLGVLSESEVEKAYRDIGYTQENAGRLREFTIKQTITSQSGLSVAKIVTAYKNGLMSRTDAFNQVSRLGTRPQNVSEIMESADVQLAWQRVKDGISATRNRYKQEIIDENQARSELSGYGLESDKINRYIQQWIADGEKEKVTLLSKTDVLALLKKGVINIARARQELRLLGYTDERSDLLLRLRT